MKLLIIFSLLFFAGFLGTVLTGCSKYYEGAVSDHFDGQKFSNPGKPVTKGFGAFFKWKLTADRRPWPKYAELPLYDQPPERVTGNTLRICFVGHAAVLIQTEGLNILTDPMWSERPSPVRWAGPRRAHPPGIHFKDLPPIDVVLISHNHYDHLDIPTLQRLWSVSKPRIIVPLGNDRILGASKSAIVSEAYDWGDVVKLSDEVAVHLEPMHHWSARGPFDRNRALWSAFTITTPGGNIYFAGDSGYGDGDYFRAAKEKFQSFRLAILPIGDYDPRWFMAYGHMNPAEALLAHADLGHPTLLPTHFQMFPLADTGYADPIRDLHKAIEEQRVDESKILTLMAGESAFIP